MSDIIEILNPSDVEEIINDWVSANIYEFVPSQEDVQGIVESEIGSEMHYGSTGDRIDGLESESMDHADRIARLEGQDSGDWRHLEERVADLERKNARLLETLGQFAQLLTHRDLI